MPSVPFPCENRLGMEGNIIDKMAEYDIRKRADREVRLASLGLVLVILGVLRVVAHVGYKT